MVAVDPLRPLIPDIPAFGHVDDTPNLAGEPDFGPHDEPEEDFEDHDHIAPNMKKKRLKTPTAKRKAAIAALARPTSLAGARVTEKKSFSAIEAKLYAPIPPKQKLPKQKSPKKSGLLNCKSREEPAENRSSTSFEQQQRDENTNGSWNEMSGPKGPMPKLPTLSHATPSQGAQKNVALHSSGQSWASIAKGHSGGSKSGLLVVGRAADAVPALGSGTK